MKHATSGGNCERKLSMKENKMEDKSGEKINNNMKREMSFCLSSSLLAINSLALGKNQSIFFHFFNLSQFNVQEDKKIMKHRFCQTTTTKEDDSQIFLSNRTPRKFNTTKLALKRSVLSISVIILLFIINNHQVSKVYASSNVQNKQQQQLQYVQPIEEKSIVNHYEALALINDRSENLRGEKPKLIPLIASDSGYSENSSVNFLCTVSQGHHETLTFDWFKDGQLLLPQQSNNNQRSREASLENQVAGEQSSSNLILLPQIDKNPDHSLLRISRVLSQHAGRYTCLAKNQFGQDSSSVNLVVNGNYYFFSNLSN